MIQSINILKKYTTVNKRKCQKIYLEQAYRFLDSEKIWKFTKANAPAQKYRAVAYANNLPHNILDEANPLTEIVHDVQTINKKVMEGYIDQRYGILISIISTKTKDKVCKNMVRPQTH